MLQLALIVFGAAVVGIGWYWGGATESRSSWVAIGAPSVILAGITVFAATDTSVSVWAFAAAAAILAGLAASVIRWGVPSDRGLGFYGFFFAGAAGLSAAGVSVDAGSFTILSLGTLLASAVGAVVFLVASLKPTSLALRRVAGWGLVFLGLGVAFLGYAPEINVSF